MDDRLSQRARAVFDQVMEMDESYQMAFVQQVCGADQPLVAEVIKMIAADRRTTPLLDQPTLKQAVEQAKTEDEPIACKLNLLAPGSILDGRYMIEKELGRGGIGVVYLARDLKLRNQVVVKTLIEQARPERESKWIEDKFRQEIEVMARINHPGVVRGLDIGALPDGGVYLVMQYIPGPSLRDAIAAGKMDLARAGNLIRQLGQALAAVHEHNVIHRDLKPENILLQQAGGAEYIKVIDFGVAKVRAELSGSTDGQKTIIVGTPAYIAPEQLQGYPAMASDIYALGVIAYEMLTGQRPIATDNLIELARKQRAGDFPKPRQLRPELPAAAEAVILRALEFDQEQRHNNAREFGDDLARALAAEEKESQPLELELAHALSRRLAKRVAPLLLMALLAAGITAYRYVPNGGSPVNKVVEPSIISERQLSYLLKARRNPDLNPGSKPFDLDGAGIIFGAGDQFRLNVSSPQSGYLYVINEGPAQTDGSLGYNTLFPDVTVNGGSALINANQPIQIPPPSGKPDHDWFIFDKEKGVEKIWLIWSERIVAEMEEVKGWANPKDEGVIDDPSQIKSVAQYLAAQAATKPEMERNEASKWTRLKGKGAALVFLVELEHR